MEKEKENENVDTAKKYTHLSLCAGYGGIDLGLELAGIRSCFTVHVEVEAFAAYNLAKKIEGGALGEGVVWPDLKTFPYGRFHGGFDILSGGFPCQPFSQAGKGHGDEDPRHLFPYILQGIRECRPSLVVLENVDGIASAKLKGSHWNDPAGTPVLLHVLRELERVGYSATAVAGSASEVGAPHQRNRWFIIGLADDRSGGCEDRLSRPLNWEEGSSAESGNSRQRWPSRPGDDQYAWEPPRVVGNPEHDGSHGAEKPGSAQEAGGNNAEGQEQASEPAGTGRPGSRGDLQGVVGNLQGKRPRTQRAEHERLSGEEAPSGTGCSGVVGNAEKRGNGQQSPERERREVPRGASEENGVGHPHDGRMPHTCLCKGQPDADGIRKGCERQAEPALGRDADGPSCGMDYAKLCVSCDNRTDELRLLGNGVVPQSCADAVIRGLSELLENQKWKRK